jgi:hypothetical protein
MLNVFHCNPLPTNIHSLIRSLRQSHYDYAKELFFGWAANVSNFPREVTESALAHVIGDKAEQAYRRRMRSGVEALWVERCEG